MKALDALFDVRRTAYVNGALMSSLSGSGSSFLNIVYKNDAKNLKDKLQDKFKSFRVEVLDFDDEGLQILQS